MSSHHDRSEHAPKPDPRDGADAGRRSWLAGAARGDGRGPVVPGRSAGARRRLGGRHRCAGKDRGEDRLHPADGLRVRGDGLGAGPGQEARRHHHAVQGGFLGRRAGQAHERRAGFRSCAVWVGLRRAPGHRRSAQGHGGAYGAEPEWPGDHPVQQAVAGWRARRRVAGQADGQRQARIHLRPDLSHRHPRHVAVLLAGGAWHRSDARRQGHHRAAAADGRQHARGQHGRLLRRRALGARAIMDKIGFTAITTQGIWADHPERCWAPAPSSWRAIPTRRGPSRLRCWRRASGSTLPRPTARRPPRPSPPSPTSIPTRAASSAACRAATRTAWASPGAIRMPCAFMPMARPTSPTLATACGS